MQKRHGDNWARTLVCARRNLPPEVLRDKRHFVLIFCFAVLVDFKLS